MQSQPQPTQRYPWGWFWLVAIFALLIPSAIVGSFEHSDPNSKDPRVQAGNLEAAIGAETSKDSKAREIRKVVNAMAPAHTTDEEADAVWSVAKAELKEPVSTDDLKALSTSKLERRRNLAALYAAKELAERKLLANKLPTDLYLDKVAKAQTFEKLGDSSLRYEISPQLAPPKMTAIEAVLTGVIFLALIGGAVLLFTYVLSLAGGHVAWRGHPVEPVSPLDADRLAVRAAQFLAIFLAVGVVVQGIAVKIPGPASEARSLGVEVVAMAIVLVSTLLLCRVPVLGKSLSLADFRVTKILIGNSLLWGMGGVLAAVPVVLIGSKIGSLLGELFAEAGPSS